MIKKYIILSLLFGLFIPNSFAQKIIDNPLEVEESYTTVEELSLNNMTEDASGGYQFIKDSLLNEKENELVLSVFNGNVDKVKELLNKGTNPNILYNVSKDNLTIGSTTLLHIAIADKKIDIFNTLLECEQININQLGMVSIKNNNTTEYREITPLAYTFYLNYIDMAEYLLQKGADPNTFPAIFFASNEQALNLLKKYNVDMDIENDSKTRPLFEAVKSNDSQKVSLLIKNGANINKRDGFGNTLLFTAISLGYFDMARFLIDNGANINAYSGKNKITPLMALLSRYDYDAGFIRYIIFKGADVSARDIYNRTPLFYVYQQTDNKSITSIKESINILIENNADINAKDSNGNTILHINPQNYYKIYSEYSPNINIQNNDGNTPLHIATLQDNVTSILTGSPNRKIKNQKGKTALNLAKEKQYHNTISLLELSNKESLFILGAEFGDITLIEKSINEKLDINKKIRGHYPIYYVAKGGNSDIFSKLISYGAKINLEPNLMYNIIGSFDMSKEQQNRVKLSNIFIEQQASLNWEKYNDILFVLVKEQCEENRGQGFIRDVINIALQNKANPNIKDSSGKAPLHIISQSQYESYDLALEFINGGADVDITDNDNLTPLYYCAKAPYNKNDIFLSLLNNTKTNIDALYGEKQNTLLMEAATSGNKTITTMLIARGADDSILNADNKTALMLAEEKLNSFDTSSVDIINSQEYQNYKYIVDKFLSDKNTVAECRSGINEECKKYYKPVDIIKSDN